MPARSVSMSYMDSSFFTGYWNQCDHMNERMALHCMAAAWSVRQLLCKRDISTGDYRNTSNFLRGLNSGHLNQDLVCLRSITRCREERHSCLHDSILCHKEHAKSSAQIAVGEIRFVLAYQRMPLVVVPPTNMCSSVCRWGGPWFEHILTYIHK